jgi:Short C-terminal domain
VHHEGDNGAPDAAADDLTQTGAEKPDPAGSPGGESHAAPSRVSSHGRLIGVRILIGVTTLLLIIGMFAVWANRLLFNADNWSNTSTQLLQNPAIRSSTANYLVDQLYANYNVAGLIGSGLPRELKPLAGPAAGALRNAAVAGTELALSRPRVQALWMQANRAADQAFVAVVNGGKGSVTTDHGVVALNLAGILDSIASRLGLPSGIASKLPPSVAHLTILRSNQLKTVQDGGKALKGLALLLTILCPLLYALAILLAPGHRRRTLMTIGFAALFAGLLVLAGRRILVNQIPGSLTNDASLLSTIRATIAISTGLLKDVATGVIFIAVLLVAAAWFAGPARFPRTTREAIAPFLRERPGPTFAITVGLLAVLFIWDPIPATGTPAGIITFTVLALLATHILIRQTAAEFPEAHSGAALEAIRTHWSVARTPNGTTTPGAGAARPDTAEQLRQLADLRDRGELTPDEYSAAKSHLLHS